MSVGSSLRFGASPSPNTSPVSVSSAAAGLDRVRQQRAPNEQVVDQHGRPLRFYDDVIRGRTVVLNVMYTVCARSCTPAMQNLLQARRLLGSQAQGLRFVSMTLTPLSDTPQALREFQLRHSADDWLFLTGRPEALEKVQRAMGFLSSDPADDLLSHSAMARLCDDRLLRWTHLNTLLSGAALARMIRFELA